MFRHNNRRFTAAFPLVLLFPAVQLLAQVEEEDSEDFGRNPGIYWHIDFKVHGLSHTSLSLQNIKNLPDSAQLTQVLTGCLQNALQCTTTNITSNRAPAYYTISADFHPPVQTRSLSIRYLIIPRLIKSCLQQTTESELQVTLNVPKHGYTIIGPQKSDLPSPGDYPGPTVYYSVKIKAGDQPTGDISIETGYRLNMTILITALLAFIFAVPFALILRLRKRALVQVQHDATMAWFGFWRGYRLIMEGLWLGWVIVLISFRVGTFISFVLGNDGPIVYSLLVFIPPMIVSFSCLYLSRPVWQRIRGITWNKKTMFMNSFWQHAATVLPLAFFLIGISSVFQESKGALLWFAAAIVTKLAGALMYGKTSKSIPRTLLGGELKEKILELAQRAGVKINQVFLMPARALQMGNAFALQGRNVMITDYLLERLTKKETDCVMAHEIGHLKKGHTKLLSPFGFLLYFLLAYVAVYAVTSMLQILMSGSFAGFPAIINWIREYLIFPLAMVLNLFLFYFTSRQFERSADEFASLLTNDPESMITGLVKLSRMNLMPLGWGHLDENLSTHPSTLKRVTAIARRYRIAPERLNVLLSAQTGAAEGESYSVPAEAADATLVFSSEFRTQKTLETSLILFCTITGYLISKSGLPSPLYLTGFLIVPFVYLSVSNFAQLRGYRRLKSRLAGKLAGTGYATAGQRNDFVGISPEPLPRNYENHNVWDVGFLSTDNRALSYTGDKIRFSIPRENITAITQGHQYPGWFRVPEIYIHWTDSNVERVFHLHSVDGVLMTAIAGRSKSLAAYLTYWHTGRSAGAGASTAAASAGMPQFPDVKGLSPQQAMTAKGLLLALLFIALLTFGISALFRLGSSLAWYGFGMSAWCLLAESIPSWRYRETGRK
jgi:Zn-dependent protease with chaperone function